MSRKFNPIDEKQILEFVKMNQPVYLGQIIAEFNLAHFSGSKKILEMIHQGKLCYAKEGKSIVVPPK